MIAFAGSHRLYSEDPAVGTLIAWLQHALPAEREGAALFFYNVRRNADEGAVVRQHVPDFRSPQVRMPDGLASGLGTEDRTFEALALLATSDMQLTAGQKQGLRRCWEILMPGHARAWLGGEALMSARAGFRARNNRGVIG